MVDNTCAINLDSASKTYRVGRQRIQALSDINLRVEKGDFVAITGESGSGKSTLLQLIGALDQPTTGAVYVDGNNTAKLSNAKLSELRSRTIGFVFQSFYLQPFLTVLDNMMVPAMFTAAPRKLVRERALDILNVLGMSDKAKMLPRELSGGQIQRIAIGRALMNNPDIILADEPTGNLDSVNSQNVVSLFKQIHHDMGATVIIVTHDQSIAAQAHRVITLRDGRIINDHINTPDVSSDRHAHVHSLPARIVARSSVGEVMPL